MTIKEFSLIAAAIKTYFPRDNILPTENAMELWYEELRICHIVLLIRHYGCL